MASQEPIPAHETIRDDEERYYYHALTVVDEDAVDSVFEDGQIGSADRQTYFLSDYVWDGAPDSTLVFEFPADSVDFAPQADVGNQGHVATVDGPVSISDATAVFIKVGDDLIELEGVVPADALEHIQVVEQVVTDEYGDDYTETSLEIRAEEPSSETPEPEPSEDEAEILETDNEVTFADYEDFYFLL